MEHREVDESVGRHEKVGQEAENKYKYVKRPYLKNYDALIFKMNASNEIKDDLYFLATNSRYHKLPGHFIEVSYEDANKG